MSYFTWSNNGYGICTSEIETTTTKIWSVLELSPVCEQSAIEWAAQTLNDRSIDTSSMSIEEIKDNITIDDFVNDFYDMDSGISGFYLASILKTVIYHLEGIRLLECDDFDGNQYLIMPDAQIWQLNDKEKSMSMTDYDKMFAKYVKYLTDQDIEVDYQAVSNGN